MCLCPFLGVGASFVFEEVLKVLQEIAEEEAADAARRGLSPSKPAPVQVDEDEAANAAESKSGGNTAQQKQKPKITIEMVFFVKTFLFSAIRYSRSRGIPIGRCLR